MVQTMAFQPKLPSHCVFQSHTFYGYEIFQTGKPELQNHIAKTLNLVRNLSLISNNTPNLYSIICAEMNMFQLQILYYCKMKGVAISSGFPL